MGSMDFSGKFDPRPASALALPAGALAAMARRLNGSALRASSRLDGGFSNANLLLEFADGERCVLRIARDCRQLTTEADVLTHVAATAPDVPVPAILRRPEDLVCGTLGALAMTFVDGHTVATVEDTLSEAECRDVCEQLAMAAAGIHAIRFPQNGLLGPGPAITEPFDSYADGATGFLMSCLDNPLLQRRAGPDRVTRLQRCVAERPDLQAPSGTGQLCHSDFNQKNLMVRKSTGGRYRLTAVLDWEFAFVGSGVVDIGNLLRFEDESPAVDGDRFADAYRAAGGHLDPTWREQSLFADLLAQCAFLIRPEDRPKTAATAIGVIDRTLAVLAP